MPEPIMLGMRAVVLSWGASLGTSLARHSAGATASLAVGVEPHAARTAKAAAANRAEICFFTGASSERGVIGRKTAGSSRCEAHPGNERPL